MDVFQEYFLCDDCRNKDFAQIYHFSIRFYSVNFSDELVYERLTEELYQCTGCKKIFTREQIDKTLTGFKKLRKVKG